MTSSTTAPRFAADDSVDPGLLRAHLRLADPAVLLAVLAQLTGDHAVLDHHVDAISHISDPPEMAAVADSDTVAEIIERLVDVLGSEERPAPDLAPDDPAFFARLAPLALGVAMGEEFLPMLLEQGGFHSARPVLPRTTPLPADLDVAIIGGGLAGIAAAVAATKEGIAYRIYERNEDVGGTWLIQNYPGVGVDTPSSYYSLSTELNPDWTSYYPKGGEYQDYLRGVADRHGIRRHTRFGTEVESLVWDDASYRWNIHVRSADGTRSTEHAAAVITAAGYLNRPQFPPVEGRKTFAGISIHSGSGIRPWT